MVRPVVGIIANNYLIEEQYPVQASLIMNLEAVSILCDAVPLIVPSIPENSSIDELIEIFDGFIFTGGRPNVHPSYYGQDETDAHGVFDKNRDAVTLPLIQECEKIAKPILGICRGLQEFNVAFNGSLHPEIRDLPGRLNHRMPPDGSLEEKFALRHKVNLKHGSVFEKIFGSQEIMVNSLHGQGIDLPGERVQIEGCAPDGTIEAISIKKSPGFALAVQWHPEWNAKLDEVSLPIFEAFGRALRGQKFL